MARRNQQFVEDLGLAPDPEGRRAYLRQHLRRRLRWRRRNLEDFGPPAPPALLTMLRAECADCGEPSELSGGLIPCDDETLLCAQCWQERHGHVREAE